MDLDSWIVGFVDGEGCFSIAINPHAEMTSGYQVQAEFAVTQSVLNISVLQIILNRFQCGKIQRNPRIDNHHEDLAIYRVRKLDDLVNVIIPFFESNVLQTTKRSQYEGFCKVVCMMRKRDHLSTAGLQTIRDIAGGMNQRAKRRSVESSETIRQAPRKR